LSVCGSVGLEKLFITVTRTAAMISHRIRFFAMSFKFITLWSKPLSMARVTALVGRSA